ncbi:MAG: 2-hydroxyacid dehydrogenase [Burkholderiales bacterium]|nr:2-hydroxyacid dehydrogenase [Burkholderiales bacterium]
MTTEIFYLPHATPEVYAMIRAAMPATCELVTLEHDDDDERIAKLASAKIVIVATRRFTRPMIDAAKALQLVHHQGVGFQDTIDLPALAARKVRLALTPSGTTDGVAEHTILLMLAILKRLPFADRELREGRFHNNALRLVSRELKGLTVGYVGMGRIAQAVAARLLAFGTRGVYHDTAVALPPKRAAALGVVAAPFDRVLAQSDIVSLHAPLTPATRHLIDATALVRMKRGAYLVNTARGGLVDEAALIRALDSGHLAGAALDVFEQEPPSSPALFARTDVVLTPHISSGTRDAMTTKLRALFDNIERFRRGEPLENEVDLARWSESVSA